MPRTGYETTPPTGGGSVKLEFIIDKVNYIRGAKQAGDEIKKLNATQQQGYSIKSTWDERALAQVAQRTVKSLEGALEQVANDWAKIVSAAGKEYFKEVIRSAPNRVKPRPGRIDTHTMLKSVRGRTKNNKDATTSTIGWIDSYYRYFSFQEDGTRNGPMPMGAVPKTAKYLTSQFNRSFGPMLRNRIEKIK